MKTKFLTARDYAKLYSRAERILDREIKKPKELRDDALIAECEETMLFSAEMERSLASEEARRGFVPSRGLKRGLVAAAAVILTLVIAATVAQAAGFRVWSALVHWDANYLRVDYDGYGDDPFGTPDGDAKIPYSVTNNTRITCSSREELLSVCGGALVADELDGFEFVSANVLHNHNSDSFIIHSRYLYNGIPITVDQYIYPEEVSGNHSTASFVSVGRMDDVYEKEILEVKCVIGTNSEKTCSVFEYGTGYCTVSGGIDRLTAELMIGSFLKGDN